MAIIKIRELIGTSEKSFDDALQQVVDFVGEDKHYLSGVHVINQTVEVNKKNIIEYKVNVKVAYKWEKE